MISKVLEDKDKIHHPRGTEKVKEWWKKSK
jgi:hypothetical protein